MRMQHDLSLPVAHLIGEIFGTFRRGVELSRGGGRVVFPEVVGQKRQQPFGRFLHACIENFGELVLHHHDAQPAGEKPGYGNDAGQRRHELAGHAGRSGHLCLLVILSICHSVYLIV